MIVWALGSPSIWESQKHNFAGLSTARKIIVWISQVACYCWSWFAIRSTRMNASYAGAGVNVKWRESHRLFRLIHDRRRRSGRLTFHRSIFRILFGRTKLEPRPTGSHTFWREFGRWNGMSVFGRNTTTKSFYFEAAVFIQAWSHINIPCRLSLSHQRMKNRLYLL